MFRQTSLVQRFFSSASDLISQYNPLNYKSPHVVNDDPPKPWALNSLTGNAACLLPNGFIIIGTNDKKGEFKIYDPKSSQVDNIYSQENNCVSMMAVLASGNIAVTNYENNAKIRIIHPNTGCVLSEFGEIEKHYLRMIAKDELIIAIDDSGEKLSIFDYLENSYEIEARCFTDLHTWGLLSTSNYILTAGSNNFGQEFGIEVYDYQLNKIKQFPIKDKEGFQEWLLINDDHIAIADLRNKINVYQISTGKNVCHFSTGGKNVVRSMAMLDENTLLVADADKRIYAFNPFTGKLNNLLQTNYFVTSSDVLKTLYPMINPEPKKDCDNQFQLRR